jgi:spore germination protein GerM
VTITVRRALAVLALVALVGCGVPDDDAPRAVSAEEIPEALVAGATTTTMVAVGVQGDLYFLETQDDQNVLRLEQVTVDNNEPQAALEALVATVPEELPEGVLTLIPPGTSVLSTELDDGVLTIDLSADFESVSGEPRIQAVAQLVFTAIRMPGPVDGVLFTVEGEQTTVPDADGADIDGPAVRDDYSDLVPG